MSAESPAQRRLAYFHLQRAAHRMRTIADVHARSVAGISAAQAGALLVIAAQRTVNQARLAAALGQRESAITTMTARLFAAGLIDRHPDPGDGRAWVLSLTARGHEALHRLNAALDAVNALIDRAVGSGAMDRFVDALQALQADPGSGADRSGGGSGAVLGPSV